MSLKSLTILNDHEYFTEITQKISATKSGDRVGLMSMSFNPAEPLTKPLMRELAAAAKRGVHVQLNVDANSFIVNAHNVPIGPILTGIEPSRTKRTYFRAKFVALENLRQNGGNYCITNVPRHRMANPYGGRSHIKSTVINDTTYVGGCNLSDTWQLDLMVRLQDTQTASWVYDFILEAARAGNVAAALKGTDVELAIDEHTHLFVDAGCMHQSRIYDQALKLIDEACERIVLTCQFFPGSTTAEHLANALKRGVNVEVYFGHTSNHKATRVPHQLAELRERVKNPKELFDGRLDKNLPRLHAKLLATEAGAMIGGHNYVVQGVNFGTAEATLFRRDPNFAKAAVAAFEARLAEAKHLAENR
jgi:phosphatidylserine/phosphatidylglycerophosphate/cardiolipin synthase-like enzyme